MAKKETEKKATVEKKGAENAPAAPDPAELDQVPEAEGAPAAEDDQVPEAEGAPFEERTVCCDGFICLNVRPAPGFGGKPVRTVPNRAKVMARPAGNGWCELEDGGFVKGEYLV